MTGPSVRKAAHEKGMSRREFMKFCSFMSGTLALSADKTGLIAEALEAPARVPVIWLEFQDCAGCTESFLRASRPTAAELVLDILSVDYHETIMAASGHRAEDAKKTTIEAGGYLLVVEGSVPTAEDGVYCCIGGRTALDILDEAVSNATAVIAVGTCATFGGIPKANPNPTGAVGVMELVKDKPVVNLAGCPYNVVNLTATVVHYLTFGELPEMDELHRPLFAHGKRIHDNCERRGHFDAGRFVEQWGDEGHRQGWCLYKMGCKGPITYHNCPSVRYNEGASWPIGSGHGCIGCSEPDFWEFGAYTVTEIQEVAPPATFAPVAQPTARIDPASAAALGGAVGVAVGAAGVAAYRSFTKPSGTSDEEETSDGSQE
jgi:hydrogenase small subunit